MRRLFQHHSTPPDARPAMLSIVALMVLLLPVLLRTTTSQKLTSLPLSVHTSTGDLPDLPSEYVLGITIYRENGGFRIRLETKGQDARDQGTVVVSEYEADDLSALQERLSIIKGMDDLHDRVILVPEDETRTADLIRWMDAVRVWPEGPLFSRVVLADDIDEFESAIP